jgi:hypothetical protein
MQYEGYWEAGTKVRKGIFTHADGFKQRVRVVNGKPEPCA